MDNLINVVIREKNSIARDVVELTLDCAKLDEALPSWSPGDHIDFHVGSNGDVINQYSLCGRRCDKSWKIAVLKNVNGKGGSQYIHDELKVGDVVKVSAPKNNFKFSCDNFSSACFIAGGIGITPILPMIQEAETQGIEWHLTYLSRSEDRMAYKDFLADYPRSKVSYHFDSVSGIFDIEGCIHRARLNKSIIYSCGPEKLLDALEAKCNELGVHLVTERFSASVDDSFNKPFHVKIKSSGQTYYIPEHKSILDVLGENGCKVVNSCRSGVCGTCETRVVSGVPYHRDKVLTKEEQEENSYMMICVSRAISDEIVLDI